MKAARLVAVAALALVAATGALAAGGAPAQSNVRPEQPQSLQQFLTDLDFSFMCTIDCGNGQTHQVWVDSWRECVEICQDLCHDECAIQP